MATKTILITGGAGFIGSHLADELLAHGHEVRLLDNLTPRVHEGNRPAYLTRHAELIEGDVRDGAAVERAVEGIDVVYHLAAAVGVGESMHEIERCTSINNIGTAVLMARLAQSSVERLVLASSMSVYGEGLYRDVSGALIDVIARAPEQLRRREWELLSRGEPLQPIPTTESKTTNMRSVYARSKLDQERVCRQRGRAIGLSIVTLRLFNVFGPRQSVTNPYTGDLSSYAMRLLAGRRPLVLEDGMQQRDWIHVRDVISAARLALDLPEGVRTVVNVGSGQARAAAAVARRMAELAGRPYLEPRPTNEHRLGDVRHCFADVGRAAELLGHRATNDFDAGLVELLEWTAAQKSAESKTIAPHAGPAHD